MLVLAAVAGRYRAAGRREKDWITQLKSNRAPNAKADLQAFWRGEVVS